MAKVDFTPIETDYEGMAKVILAFCELYKVAPDHKAVDEVLIKTIGSPLSIINTGESILN